MEKSSKKMDWFINAYKCGNLEYTIHNTGEKKGTIVKPTGTGKSSKVYEDIIYHINHSSKDEKIIFNLSAPILNLEAQYINDFFSILNGIEEFSEMIKNEEIEFYINSSADGDVYYECAYLDINKFSDIDNFKTNDAKIAIIASCHKSLDKFANKIDFLSSFATIYNYFDEAHDLINNSCRDSIYDKLSEEDKKRYNNLPKIINGSEYLYALTATPDAYVTKMINESAGHETGFILYEQKAHDAIYKTNEICSVNALYAKVSNDKSEYKITPEICDSFMKMVKEDNDKINHKILVNCVDTEHIMYLEKMLSKMGYKTFSTSAKEGCKGFDSTGETIKIDDSLFINEVDSFDGDCFVLHCYQLTCGIDIKTMSDTLFYYSASIDNRVKRRIIQIIGRTLRTGSERGIPEKDRNKKYGNILFLINEDKFDETKERIGWFLCEYYGHEGVKSFKYDPDCHVRRPKGTGTSFHFGEGFGSGYYSFYEEAIEYLTVNMDKYINEKIQPKYIFFKKTAGKSYKEKIISKLYEEMKKKFYFCDGNEHPFKDIMSDNEFIKIVENLFKKYDIC